LILDTLIGGPGTDILAGGLGKDIFVCGQGKDTILDFNAPEADSKIIDWEAIAASAAVNSY
jgi:Ca2+-binding RTX toxin-like protein